MFHKFIIPLVALAGLAFAIYTVLWSDRPPPAPPPVSEASQSPFSKSVAGSGLIEASTQNISIGTQVDGIVTKIFVRVGDEVKAGAPLFAIDDRTTRAEIDTRQASVKIAEVQFAEAEYDLSVIEQLTAKDITTDNDLTKKHFAVRKAAAQLALAHAELKYFETELERLTVRAPLDGQVLQLNVQLGSFAPVAVTTARQSALILFGSVTPLNVRVAVDENDAWRVRAGVPAVGFLRGNKEIRTPMTFVRFEPYVVPKASLTGDSTERVDTRVFEVIYSFVRGDLPIYVGQQMDVFIDIPEVPPNGSRRIK